MPKIFLIKKRLHEQQLGLQEGQELLSKADPLCTGSPLDDGPIALLSKKDNAGKFYHNLNRHFKLLFLNHSDIFHNVLVEFTDRPSKR